MKQWRYSSKNHTNECYSFQGKHEQEKERPFIAAIPEPSSLKTNLFLHHLVCSAHIPSYLGDFKPLVGMCYFLSFQWRLFVSPLGCEIMEDFISTFNGSMVVPLYDNIEILDKHFLWGGKDRDAYSRSWQIVLAIWEKVGTFYFCLVVLDKCLKIKLLSKVMSIETSPSSIPQPRFLGKFVISLCCNMFMRWIWKV